LGRTPPAQRTSRANGAHASNGCPVSANGAAFDPFEAAYLQGPAEYLRWAREKEPVFYSPRLGYWIVTRYEDVKAVFRDNILFSPSIVLEKITPGGPEAAAILKRYGFALNRTMVNEDEPDHMERRRLLMDAFLPERVLRYEPTIRAQARQCMDRFIDSGRADLVNQMFYEIPLNTALRFLGVPEEGAEQLRQFGVAHTLNTFGRPTPDEQIEISESVGRFWQVAQRIVDGMLAQPDGEGWMHESVRQHRLHPDIVTESYLRSMMMAILVAAHETTSKAATNAFMTLLSNRPAWEAICADPALIPNAVEECLRVAGPTVAWRRITTADATVGDVAIPKGSRLLIVMASANRDALHFENPDEVDLYRENAVEHLTFGYGAHQCMGKNIGRMQIRVFLEEFARRLPHIRLVPGQKFEYLSNISMRGPSALWVEWDPARNPERLAGAAVPVLAPFSIAPPSKDSIARRVLVKERHAEGEDVVRLVLADPAGGPLPAWTAGAHVDLIAGGYRRKYSLCGPAGDPARLELVIQREARGRGGSRHFSDHLRPGDALQLSGPKNLFRLDESAHHYVLFAGGIGITPILAMADRLQRLGRSYRLHYAGRTRNRMALLGRLQRDHADHLSLYVKDEGRRMALAALLADVDDGTRVYACGPTRLISELEALAAGWPAGRLRFEHFTSDLVALDPLREHGFEAELRDSNVTIHVAADQTLLQALRSAGHDVPSDCGEGLCGTCEVAVLDGPIDHRDRVLSKAEQAAQNRLMTCCSRAAGAKLVLAL